MPRDELDVLYERMLGIIGAAYSHARKASGDTADNDKLEGSFLRSLLRRGEKLHESYVEFMRAQVEAAKPKKVDPVQNGTHVGVKR